MLCIMIADLGSIFTGAKTYIHTFETVLVYIALILTIVSLLDYLLHNKNVLADNSNK